MALDIYFQKNREEDSYGYFRKLYFLTDWVSDNIGPFDNCQQIVVSKEHIEKLLSDTNKVLNAKTEEVAEEHLFSLDTDYDDNYYRDVEEVKKFCEKALKEFDFDKDVLIFIAWW